MKKTKEELVESVEEAMRTLTGVLHAQCVDTQLITIEQWNEEIAPALSRVAMALHETGITARTYKLPDTYFD